MKTSLQVNGKSYKLYSLEEAGKKGLSNINKLPKSLKVLLENILRNMSEENVTWDDAQAINDWVQEKRSDREISFYPSRVLLQDFTGVPAVVDLAALRDAMVTLGGDPELINPKIPVDLVIDHSVSVDSYGDHDSIERNVSLEYKRNLERYTFLKWGQNAFKNFRVIPPGTGIIHQVNLEYLAQVVWNDNTEDEALVYPDTLVGTDSHTTMINGLSVLGWGVGGIEAEAAMLGQPITMIIPEVVGVKLSGQLTEGTTATDCVLTVVDMLRQQGVVGKFVEFYGPGIKNLTLADRATLANMAPEYGATCGFFPVDESTIRYLAFTGRSTDQVNLVEQYAKEQGLWYSSDDPDPVFSDVVELDLGTVKPCIAGPKRPQDRIYLENASVEFNSVLNTVYNLPAAPLLEVPVPGSDFALAHGHITIAAITSCTNTSNPSVLIAAGLLAQKARAKGLSVKPWVKTSLAPGSQVVTDYLEKSGLRKDLDALGFNTVGYGCTTCIGNSGPLAKPVSEAIKQGDLVTCSLLSGNRNFEGRINPDVKANFLASPPLVVAYALAGSMLKDITTEALGKDSQGNDVFLKDIWPSQKEIDCLIEESVTPEMFKSRYNNVFEGDRHWQEVVTSKSTRYTWDRNSTYINNPPFFETIKTRGAFQVENAKILALLGDSITTDHISPAGAIAADSPAGRYLSGKGIEKENYNSYGSRRGNHEVMMRGTLANIRIRNEITPGVEGGFTKYIPKDEVLSIFEAAEKYREGESPLAVIAGKEYGTGSSRDWAAKGTLLLGVKAVICESFERIHRSNLIGMGVLPLQFPRGVTRKTLDLDGSETIGLSSTGTFSPKCEIRAHISKKDGSTISINLISRIDTADEFTYFSSGGILPYVLKKIKTEAR
ncbi:MAG: aconitate hydratase AcnA [bacterium]|nr:aconitate hydratase AcnA [bacterium]